MSLRCQLEVWMKFVRLVLKLYKKTTVDCCLAPQSGYLGVTAWQPFPSDWKLRALRRYWCGQNLGTENEITTEEFHLRVVTGKKYNTQTYHPIGFDLEYKVDTGM